MYPSGESSSEGLLPAGPSHGRRQRSTSDVDLKDIVVDNPSNDPQKLTMSVTVPKPRPLNLADNFEIVGGVPSFVWKPPTDHNTNYRIYALSCDGTRLAIREGRNKICVYDMVDNFSLVAKWEGANYERVDQLTFHNNQNSVLVVVFWDSTVALMSLSHESKDGTEQPCTSLRQNGVLEIKQEFRILNKYEDMEELRFRICSHKAETWVVGYDWSIENIITMYSIERDGFRRLQIKSNDDIMPTFVYCSIPQKALMLVSTKRGGSTPLHTRIWTDLDFDNEINTESPTELWNCQGFDFSDCGCYFLAWNYAEHGEDAIEVYDIRTLNTMPSPLARRSIGHDVLRARGILFEQNRAFFEVFEYVCPKESLVAAFLVASSSKVELTLWNVLSDEVYKSIDVTMKEMTFSQPYHVEFCINPSVKWVAVGCWTDGLFGLFSVSNGALVWSTKLGTSNRLLSIFTPLKFDASSSRLLINASGTLYSFAPPCLLEEYELEFLTTYIDLTQDFGDSRPPMNVQHQALIPKHILKQALIIRHGLGIQGRNDVLDIATSRISSNVALLVQRNGLFMIVQGSFATLLAPSFKEYIESSWLRDAQPSEVIEMSIDIPLLQQLQRSPSQQVGWIFLHPSKTRDGDSNVVFLTQDGLLGVFIDDNGTRNQDQILFGNQECFALKQSKDGSTVVCLYTSGVMTIDLTERSLIFHVLYRANLAQWNQTCLEVSDDANSILIGWDMQNMNMLTLDSSTNDEECKTIFEEANNIIPCWWADENSTIAAFLEFDGDCGAIWSICVYNCKVNTLTRMNREQWNLHISRVLGSISQDTIHEYVLQFDESNGHLWIIALQERDDVIRLVLIPLSAYCLEDCIPCLSMKDYLTGETTALEELTSQLGLTFFNTLFNGKTNLEHAFVHEDKEIMTRVFNLALHHGVSSHEVLAQGFGKRTSVDVLRNAIRDKNTVVVDFLLGFLDEESTSFEAQAFVLKEGFEGLWMNYRSLIEPKILDNKTARKVCEIEAPINILDKSHIEARVGTLDSIPSQWKDSLDIHTASEHWKSLHQDHIQEIENKGGSTTSPATLMFFAFESICKVGLKGIIRFLLMQEAPSYIFKSLLLKWVVAFKWEKVWKKRLMWNVLFYFLFISIYTTYSIWIAISGKGLNQEVFSSVCLSLLLITLVVLASMLLYQEFIQMKTYIKDGRELFPKDPIWGLRKYLSSPWNIAEVLTYAILILVIPSLHIANLCGSDVLTSLYVFVALDTLLVWIKVWYYAQAYEGTGAFVLMIENIVKDCVPFLMLAFAILTGFSFCLFVLFQRSLQEKRMRTSEGEDEVKIMIEQGFGDPGKAMVTMFYAMIGTFEPKVYYHSGSLSQIITMVFVVYVVIQMIVMVNMLIAIMGDTFDRVKSTEEEQLLLGRARYIDACEAQLNNKEINEIEESIGKYLYVLFPKDEDVTEDTRLWQGRVKTIEERVGKMIKKSQGSIMKKLEKDNEEMKGNFNEIKEDTKDLKQIIQNMNEMKEDMAGIKGDVVDMKEDMADIKGDVVDMKEDMAGIKGDVVDMKEVLRLIKEKVLE